MCLSGQILSQGRNGISLLDIRSSYDLFDLALSKEKKNEEAFDSIIVKARLLKISSVSLLPKLYNRIGKFYILRHK